ncbi:MAG: N-acetylornithine carbamoyltransferase [Planctomycetes bacterium]|nr:N-acetylornithine carbamoyltransferase [Planctomycetota bacterium]
MPLKNRHFISTHECLLSDLEALIARARAFKHGLLEAKPLAGKSVALVFFNPSLRTRTTFELGIRTLGGTPITLNIGQEAWSLEHREGAVMDEGKTEHVKDAVRVLSRYVDAIGVRCFPKMASREEDLADAVIHGFQKYSDVPILNLESSLYHPCQALADIMTIHEKRGMTRGAKVALTWAPHPKPLPTSVPNSFLLAAAQFGCEVTLAHPPEFPLPPLVHEFVEKQVALSGRPVRVVNSQAEAFPGAHVVYAKSWGGLGYYGRWEEEKKIRDGYANWIVTDRKMSVTSDAMFMHCLPARRNVEMTDEVIDGPRSAVYDSAENRLYVQMALLEAIL